MVDKDIIKTIKGGGIGVMPTDTMYGVVGSAFNKKTVERIYEVRRRNKKKPLIILISSIKDLEKFGIKNIPVKYLNSLWPDKITIIFDCVQKRFEYLHRGSKKLGFRLPKDKWLKEFISKTGPIVAPSANTEGDKPSKNIKEAQKYFGADVDFYLDKGVMPIKPSTIVELVGDKDIFEMKLIRKGAVRLKI
jgi:L-threonylcarbamoyladenylate synthase